MNYIEFLTKEEKQPSVKLLQVKSLKNFSRKMNKLSQKFKRDLELNH